MNQSPHAVGISTSTIMTGNEHFATWLPFFRRAVAGKADHPDHEVIGTIMHVAVGGGGAVAIPQRAQSCTRPT